VIIDTKAQFKHPLWVCRQAISNFIMLADDRHKTVGHQSTADAGTVGHQHTLS
jgi:hypothetical protein